MDKPRPDPDVEEARSLLAHADAERDPVRKLAALEEALDLLDVVEEDSPEGSQEKTLARNLRRSYTRRLLTQLVQLKSVDLLTWFDYAQFLLLRLQKDVESLLLDDPGLKASYDQFLALWPVDVLDVLKR
jgi:hypothetical protein